MTPKLIQIAGVAAVLLIAGLIALTYMPPPLPGAANRPDAPASARASETPAADPSPRPSDPAADARDDLYCAGAITAAHRAAADPASPAERRRLLLAPALANAGAGRLIAQGVATPETTALFADAQVSVAAADFAAGRLRIPLADCERRAEAALAALSPDAGDGAASPALRGRSP